MTQFSQAPTSADMNFHLQWEAAEKKIEELCKEHSHLRSLARRLVKMQKAADQFSAMEIYASLLWHHPECAPGGILGFGADMGLAAGVKGCSDAKALVVE